MVGKTKLLLRRGVKKIERGAGENTTETEEIIHGPYHIHVKHSKKEKYIEKEFAHQGGKNQKDLLPNTKKGTINKLLICISVL